MHRILIPIVVSLILSSTLAAACGSSRGYAATDTEKAAMDKAASDCTYKTTQLSEPSQTQIDCSNETSFVVRKGTDGKWREEARTVAGSRPAYATLDQAAKALCCR
jgi:hypothetical protein